MTGCDAGWRVWWVDSLRIRYIHTKYCIISSYVILENQCENETITKRIPAGGAYGEISRKKKQRSVRKMHIRKVYLAGCGDTSRGLICRALPRCGKDASSKPTGSG